MRIRRLSRLGIALLAALLPIAVSCSRAPEKPSAESVEVVPTARQAESAPRQASNRIVVKTSRDVAPVDVNAELGRVLDAKVDAVPLFRTVNRENDPEQLRRFFLVTYSPATRLARLQPWDVAYSTRSSELIAEAAPDEEHVLADATMLSGLCFGPATNPPKDWALVMIHAPEAWDIPPAKHAKGIRIGHPDTGWAAHDDIDQGRLDLSSSLDLIDGSADARDPLNYSGGLLNPGHGTGTASLIMSGGGIPGGGTTPMGQVTGVAPEATLIPIRTAKSVVQVFDSDLARSVQHATQVGSEVISMSLGGMLFFGLHAAIRDAVAKGVLVLAAAGNCVGFVVAPAVYPEVIAVAAVNESSQPWNGTSRGSAVTISAPGQNVWHAVRARNDGGVTNVVAAGHGTSYAVAMTAGAAALWLDARRASAGAASPQSNLQELLRADLRASATVPSGWDNLKMGAGILNARDLVQRAAAAPMAPPPMPTPAAPSELLARLVDADQETVQRNLVQLLGIPPDRVQAFLREFGPEFTGIVIADPQRLVTWLGRAAVASGEMATTLRPVVLNEASETLRAALKR